MSKILLTAILVSALIVQNSVQAQTRQATESEKRAVLALEHAMNDPSNQADVAFHERVLADDFVQVNEFGVLESREALLERIRTSTADPSLRLKNLEVRSYGSTAIVTGILEMDNREEPERTYRIAFTDVFVKINGAWKLVSAHGSVVAE